MVPEAVVQEENGPKTPRLAIKIRKLPRTVRAVRDPGHGIALQGTQPINVVRLSAALRCSKLRDLGIVNQPYVRSQFSLFHSACRGCTCSLQNGLRLVSRRLRGSEMVTGRRLSLMRVAK